MDEVFQIIVRILTVSLWGVAVEEDKEMINVMVAIPRMKIFAFMLFIPLNSVVQLTWYEALERQFDYSSTYFPFL